MLTIETIKYKNFYSVGNTPVEIDLTKAPTTLISGPNGAGKSTLLCAINFALYGKPYRNVNKPSIVNWINDRNLEVEIRFKNNGRNYKVIRGVKPALFEIYENDILLNQDSKSKDYQKYLEQNILGMSERSFHQVCIVGASSYVPFMSLPAAARREVIEDLLDIKIFSAMAVLIKEKLSSFKEELKDYDFNISISENKINLHKEFLERRREDLEQRITELDAKFKKAESDTTTITSQIKLLQDKAAELTQEIADVDAIRKKLAQFKEASNNLKRSDKKLKGEITFFETTETCPTCEQQITDGHKHNIIGARQIKIDNVKKAADTTSKLLEEAEKVLIARSIVIDKIGKIQVKVSELQTSSQFLISSKHNISSETKKLQSELQEEKNDEQESLAAELMALKTKRGEIIELRNYYDIAAGLLKDGGVKTKIIKQYLPYMNKTINQYLNQFGLPIDFHLDENFSEVIRSRFRDIASYNNFSEGEKKRIDLSILLAWRALAQSKNTINCNLLIFDETADTNLDNSAVEELMNVLAGLGSKYNVYVITHRGDMFADKMAQQIMFEKNGNFSRVKP